MKVWKKIVLVVTVGILLVLLAACSSKTAKPVVTDTDNRVTNPDGQKIVSALEDLIYDRSASTDEMNALIKLVSEKGGLTRSQKSSLKKINILGLIESRQVSQELPSIYYRGADDKTLEYYIERWEQNFKSKEGKKAILEFKKALTEQRAAEKVLRKALSEGSQIRFSNSDGLILTAKKDPTDGTYRFVEYHRGDEKVLEAIYFSEDELFKAVRSSVPLSNWTIIY